MILKLIKLMKKMDFVENKEYITNAINKIKDTKENPLEDVKNLFREFFGNKFELENTGLRLKFSQLKERVIKDKLIGLILYAATQYIRDDYNFINTYVNPTRNVIKITITSVCKCLIVDYISIENLESLCKDLD